MKAKVIAVVLILLVLLGWGLGSLSAERFIPKSDLIPAVLGTVARSYVDSTRLQPKVMLEGSLERLSNSMLLVPEVYSDFNQSTVGNYTGVGMMIGLREGQLTVISPIDDSPAAKAGIRAKDKIMQIDD